MAAEVDMKSSDASVQMFRLYLGHTILDGKQKRATLSSDSSNNTCAQLEKSITDVADKKKLVDDTRRKSMDQLSEKRKSRREFFESSELQQHVLQRSGLFDECRDVAEKFNHHLSTVEKLEKEAEETQEILSDDTRDKILNMLALCNMLHDHFCDLK